MSQQQNNDYDVIIAGAGPTGILAANLLGQYGIRTLVLDREPDIVCIGTNRNHVSIVRHGHGSPEKRIWFFVSHQIGNFIPTRPQIHF